MSKLLSLASLATPLAKAIPPHDTNSLRAETPATRSLSVASTTPVPVAKSVDHRLELSELMGVLLETGLHSDVEFEVEGNFFKAHRSILGIHSEKLKDLILTPPSTFAIQLHGKKAHPFSIFLKYLYTGVYDEIEEHDVAVAADVLALAHEYHVVTLVASLRETLKAFVNMETVFTLFQVAFDIKLDGLLNFCRDFMCENCLAVVQSFRFSHLSEDAVIDLISNDYFAPPEMEILQAITSWHEEHPAIKLGKVFEKVRFELVSLDGWSLSDVAPVCKLLNEYNIDLSEAVSNLTEDDGLPKRRRFQVATSNLASTCKRASVTSEGKVRRMTSLIDGSYAKRPVRAEPVLIGSATKLKGPGSSVTVNLPRIGHINSMSIITHSRPCESSGESSIKSEGFRIFVSCDGHKWDALVDCRSIECSGHQVIVMFDVRPIRHIRIVGNAKHDGDALFISNLSCPASLSENDVIRFKTLCQAGQTLVSIPTVNREIIQ